MYVYRGVGMRMQSNYASSALICSDIGTTVAEAAIELSNNLARRTIYWHAIDFSRNIVLPVGGFAWMSYEIVSGSYDIFKIALFLTFLIASGIGMSVGLHRYFTHHAFECVPATRYFLAILG